MPRAQARPIGRRGGPAGSVHASVHAATVCRRSPGDLSAILSSARPVLSYIELARVHPRDECRPLTVGEAQYRSIRVPAITHHHRTAFESHLDAPAGGTGARFSPWRALGVCSVTQTSFIQAHGATHSSSAPALDGTRRGEGPTAPLR